MKTILTIFAMLLTIGGITSLASASPVSGTLVPPNDEKWVDNGAYAIRSDDFGTNTWLRSYGLGSSGFRIERGDARRNWSAYPNVFRGWQWGVGTSGRWPLRIRDDDVPRVTLWTQGPRRGSYNTALDLWFSKEPKRTGPADGTELMVWLNHPGIVLGGLPSVRIDGTRWYVMSWRTSTAGVGRTFIAFIRAGQVRSVTGLWLNPLFRYTSSIGKLRSSWYWTGIDAGFELCRGGSGLAVTNFKVGA